MGLVWRGGLVGADGDRCATHVVFDNELGPFSIFGDELKGVLIDFADHTQCRAVQGGSCPVVRRGDDLAFGIEDGETKVVFLYLKLVCSQRNGREGCSDQTS